MLHKKRTNYITILSLCLLVAISVRASESETAIVTKKQCRDMLQQEIAALRPGPCEYTKLSDFNIYPHSLYMLAQRALEISLPPSATDQQRLQAISLDRNITFCKRLASIYDMHFKFLTTLQPEPTIKDLSAMVEAADHRTIQERRIRDLQARLQRLDHCLKIRTINFRAKQQNQKNKE